ncbi:PSD1 and planctomycete cytochrome C domain-containing protein [Candidatus Laterigemmans baculatus]|uniref:PSD1 and planctomycete cytochrome C domain-containing protein n=1 Tax=Candidatus Laterigemmans baculatus TaxID=2770505 RepID=UPI0028F44143|nr:PSD1 and planctomycete cytochrome C domain-containing protein [Candidatus Laterigemmans baculatus]
MSSSKRRNSFARGGVAFALVAAFAAAISGAGSTATAAEPSETQRLEFSRDVRPILSDHCFACHGPDPEERAADLRLDVPESLFAEIGGVQWIVPGKPEQSELWARIDHADEDMRMPPADSGKSLEAAERALIRRWIEEGAEWQEHWAFTTPTRPALPAIPDGYRVSGPIDRFVAARLDQQGLPQSSEADPRTLVRRYSETLVGLPPSEREVAKFSAAYVENPDRACAELVDRLLASPRYGERMAIYWFDLVRFADTVGYHGDQEHVIDPYRDYVIQAFNNNLPFDRFTAEQLAGDLLPEATLEQKIASGYNRILQTSHEGGVQQKEYLAKYSADRVRNFGSVWLGMTVACAECHDHKYDPLPQRDFYRLAAFFADIDDLQSFDGRDRSPTRREPEIEVPSPAGPRRTMVTEAIAARPIRVLHRGDWMDELGEIVEPGVPMMFAPLETEGRATRLDLARWVTRPDHPLTARVFVNRLWKLCFGRGLATSLEDFGSQGQPPTHPELLDWLACEFVDSGWDTKHVLRLMVLSATFRQSSLESAELRERDPHNQWLARQGRPRLDAELIRDNALAISGLLTLELDGVSARPYQPEGYYSQLNFPKRSYVVDEDANQYRRGVYVHWQRSFLHPMLKAFDAPSREECTAERAVSNTPQAALVLLNDPTFLEASRQYAERIVREGGTETDPRLRWAWRTALSREADERELELLRKLYEQDRAEFQLDPRAAFELLQTGMAPAAEELAAVELAAWTSVARAIFNLNEFVTRN